MRSRRSVSARSPAPARRQAHPTADVALPRCTGHGARRGRRRRAGRGAGPVPASRCRIARQPMKTREARRQHAVVGHRRFGEQDGAGFAQSRGGRRVFVAGVKSLAAVPSGTGSPLVAILSLTVAGTPSSGPIGSPAASALRTLALARARAPARGDKSREYAARRARRAPARLASPQAATARGDDKRPQHDGARRLGSMASTYDGAHRQTGRALLVIPHCRRHHRRSSATISRRAPAREPALRAAMTSSVAGEEIGTHSRRSG